jgi:DNA-binding transcriptional MerR regulator
MAKLKQLDLFFDMDVTPNDNEVVTENIVQKTEVIETENIATVVATPIEIPETVTQPQPITEEAPKPTVKWKVKAAKPVEAKSKSTRGRKSIKELADNAKDINIPDDETLFQKQYYTMGEVCAMFNVNHSLLRFWETEFTVLQPKKNKKGDRLFRPEDVKNLVVIYKLTRIKKLTIQGAKDYFKNEKVVAKKYEIMQQLEHLKIFLQEIKAKLS